MKKILLSALIILTVLSSCEKEDELQPIPQNPTTINVIDTSTTIVVDTLVDTTITTQQTYELVNCSFSYTDFNDSKNNIYYEGQPYNEFGNINTLVIGDSILVNMPIYPRTNSVQTIPLFLPDGSPEWFVFTINSSDRDLSIQYLNVNIKRLICGQVIGDTDLRFDVVEFGDIMELSTNDQGGGWATYQTLSFKKR